MPRFDYRCNHCMKTVEMIMPRARYDLRCTECANPLTWMPSIGAIRGADGKPFFSVSHGKEFGSFLDFEKQVKADGEEYMTGREAIDSKSKTESKKERRSAQIREDAAQLIRDHIT